MSLEVIVLTKLFEVVSTARGLRDYILNGEMASLLGELELTAAQEALNKATLARDPESQVWSAVNHLESAHVGFRSTYKGQGRWYHSAATRCAQEVAAAKDRWVLCLMACCYKLLGEPKLCLKALELAEEAHVFGETEPVLSTFTIMFQVWDPRLWYHSYLGNKVPHLTPTDVLNLRNRLLP
jgi:hypothetical protein